MRFVLKVARWAALGVVFAASPAFGQYGGVGLGLYGGPGAYRPGVAGSSLFNFGGAGFGPYGFGYDIGPNDRNLFGGSNYGRGGGMGFDFGRRPRGAPVAAPFPTGWTHEPGDGYRYPLYYDPVGRAYIYYPVSR